MFSTLVIPAFAGMTRVLNIYDFYCPLLKVAIEVDGGQHYAQEGVEYDRQREGFLKKSGIRVVRFNNLDVLTRILQ